MKKFLLGTTAIVGVGMITGPATAAEKVTLSLGGYMEQWVGYAHGENDTNSAAPNNATQNRKVHGVDQQSDSEVYFSGKTKLDNGITVSVRVELEADANGQETAIDESYLDVVSDTLGLLRLGADDVADALALVQANYGTFSRDYDNWIVPLSINKQDNAYNQVGANDRNNITYFTPRIFGFQAGASYSPEPSANTSVFPNRASTAVAGAGHSLSLDYKETLAGVGVWAQVGHYHQMKTATSTTALSNAQSTTHTGLNLSYAGFTLGGSYGRFMQNARNTDTNTLTSVDGIRWDTSLDYKTGPYQVGVYYMYSQAQGLLNNRNEDEVKLLGFWGDYTLSDGVKLNLTVFNVTYDEEANVDLNEQSGGWAAVAGIRLDF